ncbi:MAG TPA: serine hydrolase domain-containing protein [Lapillicoccus sp.]|nr:serine hydrolase domain-containing protein [Lapillicoccus sp.]
MLVVTERVDEIDPADRAIGVPRRTVLQGIAAAGAVAGTGALWASPAVAAPSAPGGPPDWAAFDRSVGSAFDRMNLVGAAVAVVTGDRVLHTLTNGSRQLSPRRPVTENTGVLVASTTKPMTATMVAGYVDEGKLAWDQPVVDAWSGFRAPTDQLTRTLKVRDLLNMWSGIGRDEAKDFHVNGMTAADVIRGIVNYPVLGPPHTTYFYNNDVYALGGYLPLLASGVALNDLGDAYAHTMRDRLFGPAGMTRAVVASDPRGVVDDYATGYGFDLRPKATSMPFASNGGAAPAGAVIASLQDMAAFARLQLRQGVSVTGARVASAAALAECWTAGSNQTVPPGTGDFVASGYGLGFSVDTLRDGTRVVWHNGALDGFTSYVGFLPEKDLGLVVLTNMNVFPTGSIFYAYVLNLLLDQRFGYNPGLAEKVLEVSDAGLANLAQLGRQARPVDPRVVEPFLGYYEHDYTLVRDGGRLRLLVGPRRLTLAAMPDGSYRVSDGLLPGNRVNLTLDQDGHRRLELVDFETVRLLNPAS